MTGSSAKHSEMGQKIEQQANLISTQVNFCGWYYGNKHAISTQRFFTKRLLELSEM